MLAYAAALMIVFLISGLTVVVRRGFNEIIRGLESIDARLAQLEANTASRPQP